LKQTPKGWAIHFHLEIPRQTGWEKLTHWRLDLLMATHWDWHLPKVKYWDSHWH